MAWEKCVDAVRRAVGNDKLSEDAITELLTKTNARSARYLRQGATHMDAMARAASELAAEQRLRAFIEKRATLIQAAKHMDLMERLEPGHEWRSVVTLISEKESEGASRSVGFNVDGVAEFRSSKAIGGFFADLEQANLHKLMDRRDPAFEKNVVTEIERTGRPNALAATGDANAVKVADIVTKNLGYTRLAQNLEGAYIRSLPGYIPHSHNAAEIRRLGRDAWVAMMDRKIDWDMMDIAPADRMAFLDKQFGYHASEMHKTPDAPSENPEWMKGFEGSHNLARNVSQERVYHFKPGEWFEYNRVYGSVTLMDAVIGALDRGNRNAGVMSILGPRPAAMFDDFQERAAAMARERGAHDEAAKISTYAGKHSRVLEHAMHIGNGINNRTGATIMATVRNINNFKLSSAAVTSITDMITVAAQARHNGIGVLESLAWNVVHLFPDSAAGKDAAMRAGIMMGGMNRSVMSRLSAGGGMPGHMENASRLFIKYGTALPYWTEHEKAGLGTHLAFNLARRAPQDWGALPPRMQVSLSRFGIEKAEWDVIRQSAPQSIDGQNYLYSDAVGSLTDGQVAPLMRGRKTPDEIRAVLSDKLGTYYSESVRQGMSEPTAITRNLILGQDPAGSIMGEGRRSFWQFKSFTVNFMTRSLAREMYRSGLDKSGLAMLVVGTTAMGYVADSLIRASRGQYPRGMASPEPLSTQDYGKIVLAAMAKGGGLGIYSDFLFGQYGPTGRSMTEAFAGPTAGMISDFGKLGIGMRDAIMGYGGEKQVHWEKTMAEALNFTKQHTPVGAITNMLWTRGAADYLIYHQLQEMVSPGYLGRYQSRVERENSTQFWLSPATGRVQ